MSVRSAVLLFAFLLFGPYSARSENWPQWRGPDQNGIVRGKGYPTEWGEERNIVWKVSIPGWGTSTPIVWENKILMTCEDEQKNSLICLNRAGQKLWQVHFGPSRNARNKKASGANPSPVTDGEHVYAYYKSGDLACLDLDGKVLWQLNLQEKYERDRHLWDLGTSPVLTKDLVVVAVMHQGPSYLLGLDKLTGKEVWKQSRDLGAPGEARDSYTTPLVIEDGGRQTLVVLGADNITGHLAMTGELLWRVGGLNPNKRGNYRSIASPVATGELVVAPYSRGEELTTVRLGGKGDVTQSNVAWKLNIAAADVPTPVIVDGRLYSCSDRGDITCIELATGKKLWVEQLPRHRYPFSSSPVFADGKLYVTREDATTFVLEIGEKPKLIATNSLRENTYATPVFVDGQVLLRTSDFLFCIGNKQ